MSGFSAEWLTLREPADHRARDRGLLARLAAYLNGRDSVTVLDLGCGTGSNLRAMAGALRVERQKWRLVDYDQALLDAARSELDGWQGRTGADIHIEYEAADLRTALPDLLGGACDVVTAEALLDLTSAAWLTALAEHIGARRLPVYAVLNYDGAMSWHPTHPADADIVAAFAAHQHTDKGFGAAAGPDAVPILAAALASRDYEVFTASSPWDLGPADQALIAATTAGVAQAVRESGRVTAAIVDAWYAARGGCQRARISHTDLLAIPR